MRPLDYKLIEEEMESHNIKYITEMDDISPDYINYLLRYYYVLESTEHWYDDEAEECSTCKDWGDKDCVACSIREEWLKDDEHRLRKLNWIEVYEKGNFGMSQKFVNNLFKKIFEDIYYDDEQDWSDRIWSTYAVYNTQLNKNTISIFIYNRDRNEYDNWFFLVER